MCVGCNKMKSIGEKIKKRRLDLDLSLQKVADSCGVDRSTVLRWENGDVKNMKRDKIQNLANVLLVHPSYILGLSDDVEDVQISLERKKLNEKISNMSLSDLQKLNSLIDLMFKR